MTKRLLVILPAAVLIGVGIFFIVSTSFSVRYWVDDFCSAAFLRNNGFWGIQIGWWNSWTGRYSATFTISIFELIGPWVVRILPIFLLGLLIAGLKSFFRFSKLLPLLFIFLALVNAPNIIQSFYWQTGSLNYIAPFIFLNIFLGLVVFPPKKVNLFLPGILLFIAGGFSEAYALPQLILLFFVWAALKLTNFSRKDERVKIILSGLVGAVLTLGVMSLAPGNAARAATVGHPDSLQFVIVSTLYGTKWYLLRMLSIKPFIYSLLLLFIATLLLVKRIKTKTRDSLLLGGLALLAMIFTTAAVIGSGFYSMAIIPPERTLFIAIYMILICFVVFSFAATSLILKSSTRNLKFISWTLVVINFATSFLLIKSVVSNWSGVYSEVKTYAKSWDGAEKELPLLKNITPVGGLDSFTDNKGWVASCIADYYKLPEVIIQTYNDRITK